jgi:hypothetical protein
MNWNRPWIGKTIMMMSQKKLGRFVVLACSALEYNQPAKDEFHALGRLVAKAVAKELGLPKGSYDIRSNMGGIAVSGEVTLHAEKIYIQFGKTVLGHKFMFRSCNGRKDYHGGVNHWLPWTALLNLETACKHFKTVIP